MCRLISYNVANLNSKLNFGNFYSYINTFDIFFLFETHVVKEKRSNFSAYFKDYILYWEDAKKTHSVGRASGGCLFGFKKSIKNMFSLKFENINGNTYLFMKMGDTCCHIVPRYINCNGWSSEFERFEDFILKLNSPMFLILGDLNARTGNSQFLDKNLITNCHFINNERKSKDNIVDTKGKKVLDLLESIGGVILNGRHVGDDDGQFTFCGGAGRSVIDYGISSFNLLNMVTDFSIPSKTYSDHLPLIATLSLPSSCPLVKVVSLPPKLKWMPNSIEQYVVALETSSNTDYVWGSASIDDKINVLLSKIKEASNSKQSKKFFDPKNQWFDCQCANARKKMFNQLDLFRKFNLEAYRREYVASKTFYTKLCKGKKLKYENYKIDKLNFVRNSSDWWKLANSFKKLTNTIGSSLSSCDFYDHFKDLLSVGPCTQAISWSMPNWCDTILDSPFEYRELLNVLKRCKSNKAPGIDRISYEFYQNAPRCFLEEVLLVFNRIFLRNDIPISFKKSIILPLFKKGDPNSVSNYRGLSLLDTCYKIFTGLLLDRINSWISRYNIINEYQAGFRKEYSTVDNIFNLSSIVHLNFKKKCKTYAFFVDFSCAFDTIPRNSLFYKISKMGLSTKIIQILQQLYNETTSQVWDGESLSDSFAVDQGVKQGCLLSPVLFSLYMNDLHESLPGGVQVADTKVKVLLYADDIVLLSSSADVLQYMINALYSYCQLWELKVNMSKSKVMIFREGSRISRSLSWSFGDNSIEIVNEYKYLGMLITYNLSNQKHFDAKLATAKNAINATWLSYMHNSKISIVNKLKIFNAAARSIMFYGAQVWGYKQYDQVEKLFRYFIKKILSLPKNTPNYMLYIETSLKSQFAETLRLHFNYIKKIFNLPSQRLPKILAEEVFDKGVFWAAEWTQLHLVLGVDMPTNFSLVTLAEHQENLIRLLENQQLIQHIDNAKNSQYHDLYPQLLHKGIQYFSQINCSKIVSLLFKARGGLLDLNARAFRSENLGPCSFCNLNKTENTYHFIGVCPIFKSTRYKHFGKMELSEDEVINLLNGTNNSALYGFLDRSLKYRYLLLNEFN